MIRHIVFWKLKETAEGHTAAENAEKIVKAFASLEGQIEGLETIDSGADFNRSGQAWDLALITTFKTADALNYYQNHPKHQEIVKFILKVVTARAVVDYNF